MESRNSGEVSTKRLELFQPESSRSGVDIFLEDESVSWIAFLQESETDNKDQRLPRENKILACLNSIFSNASIREFKSAKSNFLKPSDKESGQGSVVHRSPHERRFIECKSPAQRSAAFGFADARDDVRLFQRVSGEPALVYPPVGGGKRRETKVWELKRAGGGGALKR